MLQIPMAIGINEIQREFYGCSNSAKRWTIAFIYPHIPRCAFCDRRA